MEQISLAFYTVFRRDPIHFRCADVLVRSVRATMPGLRIVQLTDETTPQVDGVDDVRRLPKGKMLERRLEHYAALEGNWILVDTDVLFRTDVREVFDHPFAVAVADRQWTHIPPTQELTAAMPYNTGVVFSRWPGFWQECLRIWRSFTPDVQSDWMSEQRAFAAAVEIYRRAGQVIRVLPGMVYNYPPTAADDVDLSAAKVLHCKGQRKSLMFDPRLQVGLTVPVTSPVPAASQIDAPSKAEPLRVFIGYDARQPVAFHVAAHSLYNRSSIPVTVGQLRLAQLPITRRGLTEFTYSRFLVPYLSDYRGHSVFMDADVLVRGDIAELIRLVREAPPVAVSVVMFDGDLRFERASLMVFDNARCRTLTPEYVQDATHNLFDLRWAEAVGRIPEHWNHLVGYSKATEDPRLVHFTQGIPVWDETRECQYADEWRAEHQQMLSTVTFHELMGHSVHVRRMAARG